MKRSSSSGKTLLEIKKSFRNVDNILYDWIDASSSDYSSWRGVTCDNLTFAVVSLYDFCCFLSFFLLVNCCLHDKLKFNCLGCSNLSGLNLDGEISPAIGNLRNLVTLSVLFLHLSPSLSLSLHVYVYLFIHVFIHLSCGGIILFLFNSIRLFLQRPQRKPSVRSDSRRDRRLFSPNCFVSQRR